MPWTQCAGYSVGHPVWRGDREECGLSPPFHGQQFQCTCPPAFLPRWCKPPVRLLPHCLRPWMWGSCSERISPNPTKRAEEWAPDGIAGSPETSVLPCAGLQHSSSKQQALHPSQAFLYAASLGLRLAQRLCPATSWPKRVWSRTWEVTSRWPGCS